MVKETKTAFDARVTRAMTEAAEGMRKVRVIDDAAHGEITAQLVSNRETIAAIQAARRGEVVTVDSIDALFKSLNAAD